MQQNRGHRARRALFALFPVRCGEPPLAPIPACRAAVEEPTVKSKPIAPRRIPLGEQQQRKELLEKQRSLSMGRLREMFLSWKKMCVPTCFTVPAVAHCCRRGFESRSRRQALVCVTCRVIARFCSRSGPKFKKGTGVVRWDRSRRIAHLRKFLTARKISSCSGSRKHYHRRWGLRMPP